MPRRFVDLHTHSTASDGSFSPADVVRLADEAGMAALALCDHDTVDGLDEAIDAATKYPDLAFVPGIEVSAVFPTGTMHLLGLGIDPRGESITALASRLREAREQRNPRIIARLNDLGVSITLDEVIAGMPAPARDRRVVGRMHIAETMTAKGCVRSVDEAFAKFLGAGASAFVDKERVTPAQAIEAIRGSGGIAVLAHPVHLLCDNSAQLRRVVKELRSQGLGGIEVYHSDHDDFMTRLCLGLARELGLAVSGGSDFHGKGKPHVTIGRPRTPLSVVSGILER